MDRRFRSSILLLLFLAGLVAFAVLIVRPREIRQIEKFEKAWKGQFIFNDLKEKQLEYMEVISEEGLVAYSIENGVWWITKPIRERADQKQVALMAEAYLKARWDRNDLVGNLGEFGLFPPEGRITGRTTDGLETPPLLLGNTAIADPSLVYASIEGLPTVYMIDRQYKTAIVRYLNEVRMQDIIEPIIKEISRLNSISIEFPGQERFRLDLREDGWWLAGTASFKADDNEVDRLIRQVSENITAMAWPDDTGLNEEKFGLKTPEIEVAFEISPEDNADAPPALYQMAIGRVPGESKDLDKYFLKCNWATPIFQVSDYAYTVFQTTPEKLRDRRVLPLRPDEIVRVAISGPDNLKIEVSRDQDRWTLRPSGQPASKLQITKFLEEITDFRGIMTEPPESENPEEPRLLENTLQSAILETADGRNYEYKIGEEVGGGYHWSTTTADPSRHFLVNRASLITWPKKPDAWLSLDAK